MAKQEHLPKDLYLDEFIAHLVANHAVQDPKYAVTAKQAYDLYEEGRLSRADMFTCLKTSVRDYITFKIQYKQTEKK